MPEIVPRNPYVREIGRVEDIDEMVMVVGVDYDTVTVGDCKFGAEQIEHFAQLFSAACWEAGANAERMRADA
jgi:hypothetical protein